jgi:hypothetical protein
VTVTLITHKAVRSSQCQIATETDTALLYGVRTNLLVRNAVSDNLKYRDKIGATPNNGFIKVRLLCDIISILWFVYRYDKIIEVGGGLKGWANKFPEKEAPS